ncbi:RebB family R body protein [Chryseobacterium capnotolerans]|uniref:RebB family R body protein n=1 Tax=Chryseobacterium TaxID=59732 RepID=UPI00083AE47B|nr:MULTISPECIES: RebB family R body protein [Chryseobacterium]UHO39486.1 RebB family R body protein [Chryseobacterium capnotolerans]
MANEKTGSTVNEQITDAVTQSNVKVVAESPAVALSNVYQTAAHSTGIMFENAVNAQNQQNILTQAATTQGISQIYTLDTIADAVSIARVLNP